MIKRLSNKISSEETDIDITPMLDVVFIMLIFFIVTASFVKESGIDINKPAADTASQPTASPIVVEVTDLGEIMIQGRFVDHRSIRPTIIRLRAESPDSSVIVRVDTEAKTKQLVQAIDGIRAAKVELPSVSLVQG